MYQRNIDILYQYEGFDLKNWLPSKKIHFVKKHLADSVLTVKDLQIQALPHHVFTFEKNGIEEVGAIWFIAKLGGYRKGELGLFAEILHRYLKMNYSKNYTLILKHCMAVDVTSRSVVNYSQLQNFEIPTLFIPTINEIKQLM